MQVYKSLCAKTNISIVKAETIENEWIPLWNTCFTLMVMSLATCDYLCYVKEHYRNLLRSINMGLQLKTRGLYWSGIFFLSFSIPFFLPSFLQTI